MNEKNEHKFAEVQLEKLLLENLPQEMSAYSSSANRDDSTGRVSERFKSKLRWHISRSLSPRQREVLTLLLKGKTERQIGVILGITQQVAHIYKWRAIRKLREKLLR
jgi:DNA-binding CsgD family transcriptional regulator